MNADQLITAIANRFKALGAEANLALIEYDVQRALRFTLRNMVDNYNRYAFAPDVLPSTKFNLGLAVKGHDNRFTVSFNVQGSKLGTTIHYAE